MQVRGSGDTRKFWDSETRPLAHSWFDGWRIGERGSGKDLKKVLDSQNSAQNFVRLPDTFSSCPLLCLYEAIGLDSLPAVVQDKEIGGMCAECVCGGIDWNTKQNTFGEHVTVVCFVYSLVTSGSCNTIQWQMQWQMQWQGYIYI